MKYDVGQYVMYRNNGVCRIEDGLLRSVTEHTALDKNSGIPLDTIVSMNLWGLTPHFLDRLEEGFTEFLGGLKEGDVKSEYLLPGVIDRMIQEGAASVKVLETHDKWFGVTYAEDKQTVVDAFKALHDAGVYPEKLF